MIIDNIQMRTITILLILILSSCAITSKKLVGTYSYCPRFEVCASLWLNADSTFTLRNGLAGLEARGFWARDKKGLLLNSYTDNRKAPVVFERVNQKGFTINVMDMDDDIPLPCSMIHIYRNSKITAINTDINGIANIDLPGADSIAISSVGYSTMRFVPLANTNCFDIRLGYYQYTTLKNERWKVHGKRLYSPKTKAYMGRHAFRKEHER